MVRIMMVGSYERKRVGFGGRHSLWKRYVETDGAVGGILVPVVEPVARCLHQARSTSRNKVHSRGGNKTGQIEDLVILRAILFQSCRSEDGNPKLIVVQLPFFEFVHEW